MKNLLDKKELEAIGRRFLEAVDENPDRPGLKETPKRFAKYWSELLEGQLYTNEDIAKMFDKCFDFETDLEIDVVSKDFNDLVVEDNITIYSHCEHHTALMQLKVAIAYIPKNKVIGLSKMGRIAEMVGKRLQLQEKIGQDINEIMRIITGSDDVAVVISGTHACMTARGIKAREAVTKTASLNGAFKTNGSLRKEMYSIINIETNV